MCVVLIWVPQKRFEVIIICTKNNYKVSGKLINTIFEHKIVNVFLSIKIFILSAS